MKDPQSLGELLGTVDPRPGDAESRGDSYDELANLPWQEFCERVLNTREFRQYLMCGITLGTLPPAVALEIMRHAHGKPPDRVELTGRDGKPIETVTEVRRTVVPSPRRSGMEEDHAPAKETLH